MKQPALRSLIILLTLATALIHLYFNVALGQFSPLFPLNGLAYLVLLYALPASLWLHLRQKIA